MKPSHKASRKLLVCFISFEHWPYVELLLGGKGHLIINYPLCIAVMRAFFIMQVKYNINSGHASVFPQELILRKYLFLMCSTQWELGERTQKLESHAQCFLSQFSMLYLFLTELSHSRRLNMLSLYISFTWYNCW